MNRLGEQGLRTAENVKKMRQEKKDRTNEIKELEAKLAAVTAERDALLQGGGNVAQLNAQVGAVQSEIEDKKTPKKKPAGKKRIKDDSDDDGDGAFETPVKKKRAAKAKKEDGASIVKDEGESPVTAPKKRAPRKKVVKKEEEEAEIVKDEEDLEPQTITAPKKKAPRGKKAIKEESVDAQNENGAGEPSKVKAPAKKGGRKKAVKKEADDDTIMAGGITSSTAGATDGFSLNTTIPAETETSYGAVKGEPSEAVNLGVDAASVAEVSAANPFLKS